ncbi:hypothetical protein ACFPRA_21925 [Sporosarcina soli]|uniref:Uncharacterized protein n=1 Tax=Sporosarcina soli TaxID=334736 RepID=A0ABW0TRS9_9BACL
MEKLNKLKHLINRNHLTDIKNRIVSEISQGPTNTIYYYDFKNIGAINSSGIDEILEQVLDYVIANETTKYLYVTNLIDEFEHVFNINRSLQASNKLLVAKLGDSYEFLGNLSNALTEILHEVYKHKQVTARDLADQYGKQLNLMSTHLNNLYKKRLVIKEEEYLVEGGRQFVYKSLF